MVKRPLILEFSEYDVDHVVADIDEIRRHNPQRFEMEHLTAICFEDHHRNVVVGYKDLGPDEFWAGMVSDAQQAERAYLDRFEIADGFEIVFDLKPRYQLAVLSEVPAPWADYLVRKFELERVFEVMVLSGQVGVTKPDVRIFDIVLEKLGRDRRYLFIDDNVENLAVGCPVAFAEPGDKSSAKIDQPFSGNEVIHKAQS